MQSIHFFLKYLNKLCKNTFSFILQMAAVMSQHMQFSAMTFGKPYDSVESIQFPPPPKKNRKITKSLKIITFILKFLHKMTFYVIL